MSIAPSPTSPQNFLQAPILGQQLQNDLDNENRVISSQSNQITNNRVYHLECTNKNSSDVQDVMNSEVEQPLLNKQLSKYS